MEMELSKVVELGKATELWQGYEAQQECRARLVYEAG